MKLLLAISFSMFASATFACTNFTGKYKSEQATVYTIEQSGCESLKITDGKYRLEDQGDIKVKTAATFVGDNLTVEALIDYVVAPPLPVDLVPVRFLIIQTKDASGNIVSITSMFNASGAEMGSNTTIDQRI